MRLAESGVSHPPEERAMPSEPSAKPAAVPTVDEPITDLTDQRVVQILSTEHWSLLSARSLAYNEAFTRVGMFLTFLSASLVALALFNSAMSFGDDFLIVAAVVLAFDLIIGVATYGRIVGANHDDLRAVHGLARIRHSYTQIAPIVTPYFTSGIHDDLRGVMLTYGNPPNRGLGLILYGLTTSGGMIGLIVSLVGGVFVAVLTLLFGGGGGPGLIAGIIGAVAVFVVLLLISMGTVPRHQRELETLFPTPEP
jgi:hypothetical protein